MPHSPADGTRKVPRRRPGAPNAHPPCASAGVDTANPGCPHTETPVPGVADHGARTSSWDDIGPVSGPSVMPTSPGSAGFPAVDRSVRGPRLLSRESPRSPSTVSLVGSTGAAVLWPGRGRRRVPSAVSSAESGVFAPAEGAAEPGGGPGSNHSGDIAVRGRVEPTSAQRPQAL